jgi:hypothetical protein
MTTNADRSGPLTIRVLEYERTMKDLVPTATSPSDWEPLTDFIDTGSFERIGTFLERQDWAQYRQMLVRWASSIDSFETTVKRISELPPLVYYEIEERHRRGEAVNTVNSLTVFEFDGQARIRHLAVYLQQRATTS